MKYFLIILSVLFLGSCSATYKQIDVTDQPQMKLDPNGKVLITTPEYGTYGEKKYPSSGHMTAQAVKAAFSRHTNHVSISDTCASTEECRKESKDIGYTYLAIPEILHWEDRATEWSGLPDRIEIKLIIVALDNGEVIHSTIISGKSKWATFGGDHPQDLLPEPINNYISTLY